MTDVEFASKAVYEGLLYAILEYGLKSTDLEDQDGELAKAWRELEECKPILRKVDNLLDELDGEY